MSFTAFRIRQERKNDPRYVQLLKVCTVMIVEKMYSTYMYLIEYVVSVGQREREKSLLGIKPYCDLHHNCGML